MKAVILAGGTGRRLYPFTTTIPKPLFPIGEKPILQIIIEQLREAGICEVTIAIGYLGGLIEAYFGDGKKFDVSITYSQEYQPLGTAGPLSIIEDLSEDFLVMNGDVLTTMEFKAFMQYHKHKAKIATICCYRKEVRSGLGIIEIDSDNLVTDYQEKPVMHHLVSTGIYCFQPAVQSHMNRGERLDLPELIMRLKRRGHAVIAYELEGRWFDIGTREDLETAAEYWPHREQGEVG